MKKFKENKKFYITTSIAYVNAPPHIGFALELIQADVLARYHRLQNQDVYFLTGTDEHGAKIVKAAEAVNLKVSDFVNQNAKKFKELGEKLNISSDDFIRTSDKKKHWPTVKKFWQALVDSGDIYKKIYSGLYCVGHEAFVTKKDLVPTPRQDVGSRDSDRSVGVDYICADHQIKPEIIEEENYFFRLSKYAKKIETAVKKNKIKIIPQYRKNEVFGFLKEGLQDISFSRPRKDLISGAKIFPVEENRSKATQETERFLDQGVGENLNWGIQVPNDKTQTIYVWADALVNYISALDYKNKLKKYWPADVHLIGKDILRFHAIIWPAMLMSAGFSLPKSIFVHGHILHEGKKMSKTLGNVVDPFDLIQKYGADASRYYLLREIPSGEDGDFSYEKFKDRYNGDLAKGLGNLVARVVRLVSGKNVRAKKIDQKVDKKIKEIWRLYEKEIGNFNFHEALGTLWELISFSNRYVDKNKPWEAVKSGNSESDLLMFNLFYLLANIAWLIEPFLPETAQKMFLQIGLNPADKKSWLKTGFKPKLGKHLFPSYESKIF